MLYLEEQGREEAGVTAGVKKEEVEEVEQEEAEVMSEVEPGKMAEEAEACLLQADTHRY